MHKRKDYYHAGGYNGKGARKELEAVRKEFKRIIAIRSMTFNQKEAPKGTPENENPVDLFKKIEKATDTIRKMVAEYGVVLSGVLRKHNRNDAEEKG